LNAAFLQVVLMLTYREANHVGQNIY